MHLPHLFVANEKIILDIAAVEHCIPTILTKKFLQSHTGFPDNAIEP
jgi:hypothetical protein